jgi:release factor glutamine methyltransferase
LNLKDNTLFSLRNYFFEKLSSIYEKRELENIFFIALHHYLKINRADYISHPNQKISESDILKFVNLHKELAKEKPLAQILGEWEFYGLCFKINEHVLIPRPETEELVDLIIKEYKAKKVKIIDFGTGSGCIPISIKKHLPNSIISATDISEEALKLAQQNAELNSVEINFMHHDIFTSLDIKVDVIVSNPPYIHPDEKNNMKRNLLDYEPHLALFTPTDDSLVFYKRIAEIGKDVLTTGGKVFVEINENMGKETAAIFEKHNYQNISIIKDLQGKDRIVSCNL